MEHIQIQDDKIKSSLINVETLQKEYEVVLQQYQEAIKTYIQFLETKDSKSFISIKGKNWWGKESVKEGNVESAKECENMCADSADCSGATFNPVKKYCWTRKGDSALANGDDDDYAIVPKKTYLLIQMKTLNDRLMSINKKINAELTTAQPEINQHITIKNETQKKLNQAYIQLLGQKMELETQLQDYLSVERDNGNTSLYVTQKSFWAGLWFIIMLIVIVVTVRKMYGFETSSLYVIMWTFAIILFVLLFLTIRTPSGFAIWLSMLLFIILMKTGYGLQ